MMKTKEKVLPANMPEAEYHLFMSQAEKRCKRLLKSIKEYKPLSRKWVIPLKWDKNVLGVQSQYTDIPFRMEECGDYTSTVATSGCGIGVAKFLELFLRQRNGVEKKYSIAELAEMAIQQGYRGYQKREGIWEPTGMKHVFFDRFIPSVYGFEVERAASIESVLESLKECGFPVLLVSNKVYKNDPENGDSHFLIVCGYDEAKQKFLVFDFEYPEQIWIDFSRVLPAIRNAWLVFE